MSNKGAIKKATVKDRIKPNATSLKRSALNKEGEEDNAKADISRSKRLQSSERMADGGTQSKSMPVSRSTTQTSRTSTRKSSMAQNKSQREPTISKSSSNTSRINHKSTLSSQSRTDTLAKHGSERTSNIAKNKEPTRNAYSEKRGTSTIYMPQSLNSKLQNKSTRKVASNVTETRSSKSQKETIANARKLSRERKLSRTLSPSEVKVLNSSTRLRTPDSAGSNNVDTKTKESEEDQDFNYEDDFEDYESDFQECSDSDGTEISEKSSTSHFSTEKEPIELRTQGERKKVNSAETRGEEERMLDSGHYEIAEARKRAAMMDLMVSDQDMYSPSIELRQPTAKSYSEDKLVEHKSLPSSTDEGFEDSRSGDFARTPSLSHISIVDFRKIKDAEVIKKPRKKTRGEELLEMIKLDTMQWSLFECQPIPYEEFIRCYGKLNTQQMSTQTGEDNVDVETQTEKVVMKNKWTQFPRTFRSNIRTTEDLDLLKMDQIGVGDDSSEKQNSISKSVDMVHLSDFLNRAGRVMLLLLEEKKIGGSVFQNEKENLIFSEGIVRLSLNSVTFLCGRAVTIMHNSDTFNNVLVTIHASIEEEIETSSKQDYITDCCIGCLWNIFEPSMPIKLFYSTCPITSCSFHSTNYNIVLAGLQDGSISLWDLREDEIWHQKVLDKANDLDWTIRTPTYTSAGSTEITTHNSQVVSIRVLSKIKDKSSERRRNKFMPIQICSLDDEGVLIIWSVLHDMGIKVDDLGLSPWGNIRLIKNQEIHLKLDQEKIKNNPTTFIDMRIDSVDTNTIYIATNSTKVVRAMTFGNKTNPNVYEKSNLHPSGNITCITSCPFENSFFLIGCSDGTVRLHSINIEKPILELKDEKCTTRVKALQWSQSKAFTIYVLDAESRIHIWDLSISDFSSSHTIDMQEWGTISSMVLSSCKNERDMTNQYLALGSETGKLEVHKLKADFCFSKMENYLRELDTFMRYIDVL